MKRIKAEMQAMIAKNQEIAALQTRQRSSHTANSTLRRQCTNLHQRRVVACGEIHERLRSAEHQVQQRVGELRSAEVSNVPLRLFIML